MTDQTKAPEQMHPIRNAELHVFRGIGSAEGRFIARFYPYDTYPIFFTAKSETAAREAGENFRSETIEKHEQAFINRAKAIEKARVTRTSRKEAPQ